MTAVDTPLHDVETHHRVERTRGETILAIIILLESSRALYYWYASFGLIVDDRLSGPGRLVWPLLTVASLYYIMRQPWLNRRGLDPLVFVTIALVSASFLWSVDIAKSLYQSIVLAAVVACGAFLSIAFERRDLIVLSSNVLGVVCVVNLGAIVAGVDNGTSQTTGFFEHKNILGIAAAVALLFFVARVAAGERGRLVWLGCLATAVSLFLSGSRTSQLGTLVAIMIVVLIAVRRRSQPAAVALAAPMIAVLVLAFRAVGGISAILVASGKSSDLTGRTEIWEKVTSLVEERPAAGWGFLAYWRDTGFADGRQSGFQEFGLRSAHSGYLEAALGAGILAGVLVAVTLIVLTIRGFRRSARPNPNPADVALFSVGLLTAIVNVSETLFPATSRTLLTLVIVALSAGPMMRERQ